MFKTSTGEEVDPSISIFPLLTFLPKEGIFKCLGTGFFISPLGGFITAKHVFFDNKGNNVPTLYAVQTINNNERIIRQLAHLAPHPNADIAIGMMGNVLDKNGRPIRKEFPIPPSFTISMGNLNVGDEISTYAFPRTTTKHLGDAMQQFTFKWTSSNGIVVDYCPEGSPIVRNACYQTTLQILDGASGGPVFKGNVVVGVNSSSFDLADGEEPISYITPTSFIKELNVPEGDGIVSVESLINDGFISAVG